MYFNYEGLPVIGQAFTIMLDTATLIIVYSLLPPHVQ